MSKIGLCLKIAVEAHAGQVDKNGDAYILHPLAVGLMGQTDEERMAGFLHDVVEDTSWTFEQLEQAGVPDGVVDALRLLTHKKDKQIVAQEDSMTEYRQYVQRIVDSHNPIALAVKRNDLMHNLGRCSNEYFLQKYTLALEVVNQAWDARTSVELYEPQEGRAIACFACGCFWGVQHLFAKQPGVTRTFVGYTGGTFPHPTYAKVRSQQTDHVEAVLVEYDPMVTDYEKLCQFFFEIHDPAQTDGQGEDIGQQYRSMILYYDKTQHSIALSVANDLRCRGYEVNTIFRAASDFWIAEEIHQNYYDLTGGSPYCHIRQKKF